MAKVGVFGRRPDRQSRELVESLNRLEPGSARFFPTHLNGRPPASLSEEALIWDGEDLTGLDTAVVRGFTFEYPVVPRARMDQDWSLWQIHHVQDQQKYSFLFSVYAELARRGVILCNTADAHALSFMKFEQLQQLRRAGLHVAEMICTNDAHRAEAFSAGRETVLWRPATGRGAWQLCLEKQRRHLFVDGAPPVMLADTIRGPLIRAYVFAGRPLMAFKLGFPACRPLETLEVFLQVELPIAVETALRKAADVLGVRWAMVTLVQEEMSGHAWIYDVDVDPHYDCLPDPLRGVLQERLARCLLGRDVETTVISDTPLERQSILLRRMLRVLFDMEASKYAATSGSDAGQTERS